MKELIALLNGKKTYLAGIAGLAATFALSKGWISVEMYNYAYSAAWIAIAMAMRAAIGSLSPGTQVDIPLPGSTDTPPAPTQTTASPDIIAELAKAITASLSETPKGK